MKKIFLVVWLVFIYSYSYAQIPKVISYQGILTDTSGNVKPDGNYDFTFHLYESSSGGSAIWTETKTLPVKKGLFSTNLGNQTAFDDNIKFDQQYWLGIKIGSDAELSPRINITSVGYSISSEYSDTAKYARQFTISNGQVVRDINGLKDKIILKGKGGAAVTSIGDTLIITTSGGGSGGGGVVAIQNTDNSLSISDPTGPTVTINTQIPLKLEGSSDDYIAYANNTGYGYGVYGKSVGVGLYGESDYSYGVYGYSPNSVGVLGASNHNIGAYGGSNDTAGVVGQSTNSLGILARTFNQSKYALEAFNSSVNGDHIFCGLGSNDFAVFAQNYDSPVYGALGSNSNSIISGVFGYSNGQSIDNAAVYGISTSSAAAILGYAPFGGYAAYFVGPVKIVGDIINNNNIELEIDHPLDPANKYLVHSAVESPDMKNIYDGVVTTDADGSAVINLPSYFQSLNIDYRYQLTVIGQFAQAIVETEISNNQFTIKTDKPNVKVSWQVTGIRNDAYAKANPLVVEQEKASQDRGKYLIPELFGQPKENAINYIKNVTPATGNKKMN